MRIPEKVRGSVFLALCVVVGIAGHGGLPWTSWAETEPVACARGHQMALGDTCAWTMEGDDVEVHVDADGCALVTSKNYMMRYSHPGPRLCPGGAGYSTAGISAPEVGDTIVTLTSEAPLCGVLSISRPSLDFDGAVIRVWPGLDLEGVMVRWSGAHWTVEETPGQQWMTPRQQGDVGACRSGQQLQANDVCRFGDHVAVIGQEVTRVDVWENGKVGPEKWVVDPDGTCYALASMSARPFSSITFGGLQLIWDQIPRAWTVVEPRPDR